MGKLVAAAIHSLGPRKARPLVVKLRRTAAEPGREPALGHEKGVFTGPPRPEGSRSSSRTGRRSSSSTRDKSAPELQAKLLRVLQDGTFERVGGDRTRKVDVRVIAVTNRNLARDVVAGRFRQDL